MTLTFGSLFAGIGGIDLGLERAGMECKWQVEINDYCNKILEKHWPEVKRYGDIREVDKSELEYVDLICGGFPCQPVSVAGQRKGTDDERWLWPEMLETIRKVGPEWVLVENVPGLLSINAGKTFANVLRDLAKMGYNACWGSPRASDIGANHRRERVFIMAYSMQSGLSARNALEYCSSPATGTFKGCESIRGGSKALSEQWSIEPNVGRVANGIPARVDRLKALGNAVVPQVAEFIGMCILEAEILSVEEGT